MRRKACRLAVDNKLNHRGQHCGELITHAGRQIQRFIGCRIAYRQLRRCQQHPFQAVSLEELLVPPMIAVRGITDDRMSRVLEVTPYLMAPAGSWL